MRQILARLSVAQIESRQPGSQAGGRVTESDFGIAVARRRRQTRQLLRHWEIFSGRHFSCCNTEYSDTETRRDSRTAGATQPQPEGNTIVVLVGRAEQLIDAARADSEPCTQRVNFVPVWAQIRAAAAARSQQREASSDGSEENSTSNLGVTPHRRCRSDTRARSGQATP